MQILINIELSVWPCLNLYLRKKHGRFYHSSDLSKKKNFKYLWIINHLKLQEYLLLTNLYHFVVNSLSITNSFSEIIFSNQCYCVVTEIIQCTQPWRVQRKFSKTFSCCIIQNSKQVLLALKHLKINLLQKKFLLWSTIFDNFFFFKFS